MSDAMKIYTDGGCYNTGDRKGLGAFAFLSPVSFDDGYVKVRFSKGINTTNNRMEMMAVIGALMWYNNRNVAKHIITDSGYVVKGWTNPSYLDKWKSNGWVTSTKKPVLNKDLWEKLYSLQWHHPFTLELMRGHYKDNNKINAFWNDICDKVCTYVMQNEDKFEANLLYTAIYDFNDHKIHNTYYVCHL